MFFKVKGGKSIMKYVKPNLEIIEFSLEQVGTVTINSPTDFDDTRVPETPINPNLIGGIN